MQITRTDFPGLIILKPTVFEDDRGYFMETHNQQRLKKEGVDYTFVQDNESKSQKGVIRGLHFQVGEYAQAKLVRVFSGAVQDVVVDLRKDSPTYGKQYSAILSGENRHQLLIPRGFAHGFAVLEENTVFFYKCDNFYSKDHEGGFRHNDPVFEIDWQVPINERIISERDQKLPLYDKDLTDFYL